jgi:hypothetical protein
VSLVSYTPPKSRNPNELVRIGLYNGATGSWRGSATSAAFFGDRVDRQITIHVDESGAPYHIGAGAKDVPDPAKQKKDKKDKKKKGDKKAKSEASKNVEWRMGETVVEVSRPEPPPIPVLNQPVVLNDEGMVKAPLEQQRTFLQK